MFFQIRIRRSTTVRPFRSAVISSVLSLSGAFLLTRIIWKEPSGHIWSIAGLTLLLALIVVQLRRIHNLYEAVDQETIERVPVLRRALNETVRSFAWGNIVVLLFSIAVFQFYLLK